MLFRPNHLPLRQTKISENSSNFKYVVIYDTVTLKWMLKENACIGANLTAWHSAKAKYKAAVFHKE